MVENFELKLLFFAFPYKLCYVLDLSCLNYAGYHPSLFAQLPCIMVFPCLICSNLCLYNMICKTLLYKFFNEKIYGNRMPFLLIVVTLVGYKSWYTTYVVNLYVPNSFSKLKHTLLIGM